MTSSRTDAETALNRLIASEFRFVHPRDAEGNVVSVVGVRAHDTLVDVVRIEGEQDVTAVRMPADEADIMRPSKALWQQRGSIGDVVERVLALSDGEYADPQAEPAAGCWVPASAGREKFLLAS